MSRCRCVFAYISIIFLTWYHLFTLWSDSPHSTTWHKFILTSIFWCFLFEKIKVHTLWLYISRSLARFVHSSCNSLRVQRACCCCCCGYFMTAWIVIFCRLCLLFIGLFDLAYRCSWTKSPVLYGKREVGGGIGGPHSRDSRKVFGKIKHDSRRSRKFIYIQGAIQKYTCRKHEAQLTHVFCWV